MDRKNKAGIVPLRGIVPVTVFCMSTCNAICSLL